VKPGPFTGDVKSNSSSFISDVFATFSKSAGKTRSPTLRCWKGRNSLASWPPCARHWHDGRITSFECQTPVSPSSCCMVNSVVVEERSEYSASATKTPSKLTSKIRTSTSQPGNYAASDRLAWRSMIHKSALHSEFQCSNTAKEKRQTRKARADNAVKAPLTHRCQTCGTDFQARIGLISHLRTHRSASIKS